MIILAEGSGVLTWLPLWIDDLHQWAEKYWNDGFEQNQISVCGRPAQKDPCLWVN